MSTYTFTKKDLEELKEKMLGLDSREVWFQASHHGGCLQVVRGDKHLEVFCKKNTGYQSHCRKTTLIEDSTRLAEDWLDFILDPKVKSIKFKVTTPIKKGEVKIRYEVFRKCN